MCDHVIQCMHQKNSIIEPTSVKGQVHYLIFFGGHQLFFYKMVFPSPLKLPWWGRTPTNCGGAQCFLYKMDGPGNWYLYKMRWKQKTVQNDRASTKTGDSWWIEKFEAISIMFGGHMSMYKNKDSFCRHVPGHADPLRFLQMSQDTPHKFEQGSLQNDINFLHVSQDTPTSSNKDLYKMTSTFFTCPRIPPQVRTRISTKLVYGKMSLQSDPTPYKNSLYKMTEPKPIFWAKPCPAQNDGLCRARALPFCAGNFKGDVFPISTKWWGTTPAFYKMGRPNLYKMVRHNPALPRILSTKWLWGKWTLQKMTGPTKW